MYEKTFAFKFFKLHIKLVQLLSFAITCKHIIEQEKKERYCQVWHNLSYIGISIFTKAESCEDQGVKKVHCTRSIPYIDVQIHLQ